jgi:protein-disulfide isomerase
VSLAVIALCGTLTWTHLSAKPKPSASRPATAAPKRPEPPPPAEPISLAEAATKGASSATVALIEYSDFQCPFCGVFARTTLGEIEERYVKTGKVLFAFRNLPLETIHATAMVAAQAGKCADDQGKFWPMHDWMFANQKRLTYSTLAAEARDLRLDGAAFSSCLYSQGITRVRAEQAEARSLKIDGTPTFFIGRIAADGSVNVTARLTGAKSAAAISAALDALLNESAPKH